MKVFLLQDVTGIGKAGSMQNVADGHALNFLVPRKLAAIVTPENEKMFVAKVVQAKQQVVTTEKKTSQLADRIAGLQLVLKKKIHDGDKLYGAVTAGDLVDLFAAQGISVSKSQIELDKAIKTKGSHTIIVKLSNALKPSCTLKIVPEV